MNISKLSPPERLALYGAAATVVGAIIAAATYPRHWGLTWLAAILGLAMLAILFLPQISPTTKLPGNKGSLMLVVGGVAGLLMAIIFLTTFSFTFEGFDLQSLLFLVGVAGSLVMARAGWQAFQAEGGKFDIGMSVEASVPPVPFVPPPAEAPPAAPPAENPENGDEHRS
jgi:hypothetical protein